MATLHLSPTFLFLSHPVQAQRRDLSPNHHHHYALPYVLFVDGPLMFSRHRHSFIPTPTSHSVLVRLATPQNSFRATVDLCDWDFWYAVRRLSIPSPHCPPPSYPTIYERVMYYLYPREVPLHSNCTIPLQ
ncbi:hypothetical protein DL96DRAFT_711610 [Flagelloscypha sp. PMI_526]|nr:hypothetical protein DL96DRAFT_711610 [Flagelloscypha sp. PMI_526]